jgi:hypothetical protein
VAIVMHGVDIRERVIPGHHEAPAPTPRSRSTALLEIRRSATNRYTFAGRLRFLAISS